MRILLDECVPQRVKKELPGHEVFTVPEVGWASRKNGILLKLAEGKFDVFVTVDRGMRYQQDLSAFNIAIIVLVVRRNKFESIQPLLPALLEALNTTQIGEATYIGSS